MTGCDRVGLGIKINYIIYEDVLHYNCKIRPVLDRFQDSSKTGLRINCSFCFLFFATFLPPFFAAFFAAFFRPAFLGLLFGLLFEYAVQKTFYFEYAVQKSDAVFLGGGEGCVCVEVTLRTACCCQ
jgi:hypothetical protein